MGGGRNPHREEQVKGLNNVALAHGKAAIRENSGRPLVRDLVAELLRLELIAVQRDKVSQLSASYEASFGEAGEGPQPEANEEHKACRRPWNAPPPCRQGLKVNIAARLFCGLFRWFSGTPGCICTPTCTSRSPSNGVAPTPCALCLWRHPAPPGTQPGFRQSLCRSHPPRPFLRGGGLVS